MVRELIPNRNQSIRISYKIVFLTYRNNFIKALPPQKNKNSQELPQKMSHLEDLSLKEEYDQDYEDRRPSYSLSSEYQRALARYKDEEYSQESDNMIQLIVQDQKSSFLTCEDDVNLFSSLKNTTKAAILQTPCPYLEKFASK